MGCAILFASRLYGVDGCTIYAANIIYDTTLGVAEEWALQVSFQWCLAKLQCHSAQTLLETGSYYVDDGKGGKKIRYANYVCQLGVWLIIVTIMKVSMVALMQLIPDLVFGIDVLLGAFEHSPRVKLFVVMICIPMMMNTFQFVVTDNFIKKKEYQHKALR